MEKVNNKIINFINSLYCLYFVTGLFSASMTLKDFVPVTAQEHIAYLFIVIFNMLFWLPMKLCNM